MSNKRIRSTDKGLQHVALARAQMFERLGEARERHRLQRIAQEARMIRDAERTVQQARLDIARTLM